MKVTCKSFFQTLFLLVTKPTIIIVWLPMVLLSLLLLYIISDLELVILSLANISAISLYSDLLTISFIAFVSSSLSQTVHLVFLSLLGGLYWALIVELLFVKKVFSISGAVTAVAAFFGVSLGVTCLSCGTFLLYFIMSIFGSSVAGSLTIFSSGYALLISETILAINISVMIYLHAAFTIKKSGAIQSGRHP